MASYFIRIDTYWQGSKDYFVGPFGSREEAEAVIETAVHADGAKVWPADRLAGDVKDGIRVHGVVSKTQAKQYGLSEEPGRSNVLGPVIPRNRADLIDAVNSTNEWA